MYFIFGGIKTSFRGRSDQIYPQNKIKNEIEKKYSQIIKSEIDFFGIMQFYHFLHNNINYRCVNFGLSKLGKRNIIGEKKVTDDI